MQDESIYSLIARLSHINGYRPDFACNLLLGEHLAPRVADAKINLQSFQVTTLGLYGNRKKLIQALTNLNFRKVIATPLLNAENSNKWERLISDSNLTLAAASNYEEHIWRWCPECVNIDYKHLGFTYWKKTHQLPGVFVCSVHKISLNEATIQFRRRQSKLFLPDTLPPDISVIKKCPSIASYNLAIKLSRVSKEILCFPDQNLNQATFRNTIKHGLNLKGLITRNGLIRKEAYKMFISFYEPLMVIDEIKSLSESRVLYKQIDALLINFDINIARPVVIPMLILWLYGNWELFKNTYDWQNTLTLPCLQLKTTTSPQLSRDEYRSICLEFIHKNPGASRKDFWSAYPKPCKWLVHQDNEWIEQLLPAIKSNQFKQKVLFR